MGTIEANAEGTSARVYLTVKDDVEYIGHRFSELPWVDHVEVNKPILTIRVFVVSEAVKGRRSLIGSIAWFLRKFRLESADAVRTASDDDNGWKDIIRYRHTELNDELIGHVGATPTTDDEPEQTATTTDRPVSPLAEIIREVGCSMGLVEVTVVGLTVYDVGYDIAELHVKSLPN